MRPTSNALGASDSQTYPNFDEFAGSIFGTRFSFSLEDGKLIFAAGRSRMYDVKTLIWANNHMRVLVANGLVVANSSAGIVVWLWFWLAELLVTACRFLPGFNRRVDSTYGCCCSPRPFYVWCLERQCGRYAE